MKLFDITQLTENVLTENAVHQKLKNDARLKKMVAIHFRHDTTVPGSIKFKLGPKPTDDQIMDVWLNFVDRISVSDVYGDVSPTKAYHEWITKVYAQGATDWEDIASQFADSIMHLQILSRRDIIPADRRDINKYSSMAQLTNYVNKFAAQLRNLKAEELMKRQIEGAKHVTIVDNEDYAVVVPMNMGAGIKFGRSIPPVATWCTATTSNNFWTTYASKNYIFIFFDKKVPENKYQASAADRQFMNIKNNFHNLNDFATNYPCAMEEICDGMLEKSAELATADEPGYREYHAKGGDAGHTVNLIRQNFATAFGECNPQGLVDDYEDEQADADNNHGQGDADYEAGPEELDAERDAAEERRRLGGEGLPRY